MYQVIKKNIDWQVFGSEGLDEELHNTGSSLKRWIKRYSRKNPQFA
jgi:hypothetical protein